MLTSANIRSGCRRLRVSNVVVFETTGYGEGGEPARPATRRFPTTYRFLRLLLTAEDPFKQGGVPVVLDLDDLAIAVGERIGCATWTSCAAVSSCTATSSRVRSQFVVGTPQEQQEPYGGGARRSSPTRSRATAAGKGREDLLWCARSRVGGYLHAPPAGPVLAGWPNCGGNAARRLDRDVPPGSLAHDAAAHRGQPGHLGAGANREGGAADARARQRGDDAGRVRRPVRVRFGRGRQKCVSKMCPRWA